MKGISPAVEIKVIINKLRGKVSLVEQNIIDYASTAYFEQNGYYGNRGCGVFKGGVQN